MSLYSVIADVTRIESSRAKKRKVPDKEANSGKKKEKDEEEETVAEIPEDMRKFRNIRLHRDTPRLLHAKVGWVNKGKGSHFQSIDVIVLYGTVQSVRSENGRSFILEDDSGTINIISGNGKLPVIGSKVMLQGTFRETLEGIVSILYGEIHDSKESEYKQLHNLMIEETRKLLSIPENP